MKEDELFKRQAEFQNEKMSDWIVFPTRVTKALKEERHTMHGDNYHVILGEDEVENLRGHSEVTFEVLEDSGEVSVVIK